VWQTLNAAKRPLIVIGSSTLQRPDGAALHRTVSALAQAVREKSGCGEDWRVLNILQRVCLLQWETLLHVVWGYLGGSPTAVQAWQPCPLWELSPSLPILV